MISYAQNFEDVMIARLFPSDHRGFYIDVGAADPVRLSVTKHFYDAGWHGINVEPLPSFFERIQAERPRDINVNAVIGRTGGGREFFEISELPENSTNDKEVMARLQQEGRSVRRHMVQAVSLADLCEQHASDRVIDFMKIDVEGGELEVLQSADWQRYRPVLVIIEAVVVNGREETWMAWESIVTDNGYEKVWFDGLNNFYLRHESLELKLHFRLPPNVFDSFELAQSGSHDEAVRSIDADRRAKQEVVDRLIVDLTAANSDRAAKQEVVDRLIADLTEANADRAAKEALIDRLAAELKALRS